MVSKSYVVSQITKTLTKKSARSEDDVEKHCCGHNMSETKKNKNSNLFVIQMNELVSFVVFFV
jgi:hypothetical protein